MSTRVNKKEVFKYLVMPQLTSRFKDLFTTGFQYIPFFIALVYQCVRILPANHPYVSAENIGQFGVRHVIAEAANNIQMNKQNIDQILVFGMIMLGLGIFAMQIFMMVFGIAIQPALAQAQALTGMTGLFTQADPSQDLAYMFLDMVFGLPQDVFGSCVSTSEACMNLSNSAAVQMLPHYPSPAHVGLHHMFRFYSMGLLVVAVFITTYFIITILAETAQTGTPMGKRFNKVWAPIRLVVAFGLLVPIGSGLNSAQHLVLFSAKMGSNFATNGWIQFNETLSAKYTDGAEALLVSTPNIPEVGTLLQFMYTARTCYETHKARYPGFYGRVDDRTKLKQVHAYLVRDSMMDGYNHIRLPEISGNVQNSITNAIPYEQLIEFAERRNTVKIRFGIRDPEAVSRHMGNVIPTCGELTFKLEDSRPPSDATTNVTPTTSAQTTADIGPELIQKHYWYMIKELWYSNAVYDAGANYPKSHVPKAIIEMTDGPTTELKKDADGNIIIVNGSAIPYLTLPKPDAELPRYLQTFYENDLKTVITGQTAGDSGPAGGNARGAVIEQALAADWQVDNNLVRKGWGGAAIWYNKIAQMNGPVTGAVLNIPAPTRYPEVMEHVKYKKSQYDKAVYGSERFNPNLGTPKAIPFKQTQDGNDAQSMYEAFDFWQTAGFASSGKTEATGNPVIDLINAILGTNGLFTMRDNQDVHPLAQVVGIGKGLVDSSIANIGRGFIISVGGNIVSLAGVNIKGFTGVISGFMITIAMIGLTAGFVLFYIVPFLPFIYFFFALGGWIKGIFEAMVGAPLWALAHIRIDGDGLTGKDAASGYYLIFEIFLRPILVIFGFLASITIFSATVSVLNDIFDIVTSNIAGHDSSDADGAGLLDIENYRGTVDSFFYTIVYAIIVYLTGMASFKLIDQIPNSILRWMGQSVKTFNDEREDPAEKMVSTATIGSQQAFRDMGQGLGKINSALGGGK